MVCGVECRRRRHETKIAALATARDFARSVSLTPSEADRYGLMLKKDGQRRSAFELLSHPTIGPAELATIWPQFCDLHPTITAQIEIDAKLDFYPSRTPADF